ncbi:MAG: hypothetical protein V1820_05165 [archaeon]
MAEESPEDVWTIKPVDGVSVFCRMTPDGEVPVSNEALVEALEDGASPLYSAVRAHAGTINIVPPDGSGIGVPDIDYFSLRERVLSGKPVLFRGEMLRTTGENGVNLVPAEYATALSGMEFLRNDPFGINSGGRIVRLRREKETGAFVDPEALLAEEIPSAFSGEFPLVAVYEGPINLPEADPAKVPTILRELAELVRGNPYVAERFSSGGVFLYTGEELVFHGGKLSIEAPIVPRPGEREYAVVVSVDNLSLETGKPESLQSGNAKRHLGRLSPLRCPDAAIHLANWDATPAAVKRTIRSYAEAARRNEALFHLAFFTHGGESSFELAPDEFQYSIHKYDIRDLVGSGIPGVSIVANACHAEMSPYTYGVQRQMPSNSIGFFACRRDEVAFGSMFPDLFYGEMGGLGLREFIGVNGGEFETKLLEVPYSGIEVQWFLGDKRPTKLWVDPAAFQPVVVRSEGFDPSVFYK